MKFFSNEPKDNPDDDRDRGSDVVTSEPVAVPQQRAGSPWDDSPDPAFSDRGTTTTYGPDGTVTETSRDEESSSSSDSVAREDRGDAAGDDPFRDDAVKDEPFQDDTAKDEAAKDEAARDDAAVDGTANDDGAAPDDAAHDRDSARKDEGTFDSPTAVEPATGDELDSSDKSDLSDETRGGEATADDVVADDTAAAEDEAVRDDGTFDSPTAVDPATGDELDKSDKSDVDVPPPVDPTTGDPLDNAEPGLTEPVVAVVPENAGTPGSVPAPGGDRLFAGGDSFAERFREIQLTFVDSPKEATAQAAALVSEAVEAVTAALNEKKNALAAGSEDTEQLRVELRGYRDLLKRISEL